MTLETLISRARDDWRAATTAFATSPSYKYAVDVLSGWLYYTPTYALQELAAGKDLDTVVKTRTIGMAAHALAMRPIGMLRNYVAQRWGVTQESPLIDKMKVNLAAVTPIQSVVYGGMLAGGMAWSGNWDWESSAYAWGMGVALGVLHAVPYGFVQDGVRTLFGVRPAIASKEPVQPTSSGQQP